MSIVKYTVTEAGNGAKIRDYMKDELNLSGRFIRNSGMDQRLMVNGKVVRLSHRLSEGDEIQVKVTKEESQDIEGENLNIQVIYEDDDLLIVNKPPFMVVHPTKSHPTGTLANGVIYHFRQNNDDSIVRLVSRLDRDTSGLIMIAKNQFSHMNLAKAMEQDLIEKSYLAIIHGHLTENEGTIDRPIGRPTNETIKRAVLEDGQRSVTHYKVIEEYEEGALVQLLLETGRTHQIRVHLSYEGHPIYGESLYSDYDDEKLIDRQALHAFRLKLPHPRSGKILEFQCEMPEDMRSLVERLKG